MIRESFESRGSPPIEIGHFVVVREPSDVDTQLVGWLAEAQALQAGRSKP